MENAGFDQLPPSCRSGRCIQKRDEELYNGNDASKIAAGHQKQNIPVGKAIPRIHKDIKEDLSAGPGYLSMSCWPESMEVPP